MAITPKQRVFVDQYLVDLNASEAARRAGYTGKWVNKTACELMARPEIQTAIAEAMAARSKRTEIDADQVLKHWWDVATADPRELSEFRRTCCRYCWGAGNRYQRTAGEMERDREAHAKRLLEAKPADRARIGPFDEKGGIGYHAKRDPNAECEECFGDGVGDTFVHDTRQISPAAARLYAGMKQTKEGLEVKTQDQAAALERVARHLGMFKAHVELTGKNGGPVQSQPLPPDLSDLSDAELEQLEQLLARASAGGAPAA